MPKVVKKSAEDIVKSILEKQREHFLKIQQRNRFIIGRKEGPDDL